MLPQSAPEKEPNSPRVNLLISVTFHVAIVLALAFLAAREGLLGKQLKKITVEMVKETPPQKPKEPEKPAVEPPTPQPAVTAETPKAQPAKTEPPRQISQAPPPAIATVPPAVAPAPAELASFDFEGGKAVQTTSDPVLLYKAAVENELRANWRRPVNISDDNFVAEVEIAVNPDGHISDPQWKKGSGDARWDDSVRRAISATKDLRRRPPTNFPARVLVRFDVQDDTEPFGVN